MTKGKKKVTRTPKTSKSASTFHDPNPELSNYYALQGHLRTLGEVYAHTKGSNGLDQALSNAIGRLEATANKMFPQNSTIVTDTFAKTETPVGSLKKDGTPKGRPGPKPGFKKMSILEAKATTELQATTTTDTIPAFNVPPQRQGQSSS